eukprot:g1789.t1
MACCILCFGGSGPGKLKADLANVPDVDSSKFTFVEMDETNREEYLSVGTRSWVGSDNAPGMQILSWTLAGGGDLPTTETREALMRNVLTGAFLQARNFGGIILGVKDVENKLLGHAVIFPPGTVLQPGSSGEMCTFCHLMCCKGLGEPPIGKGKIGEIGAKRFKAFEAMFSNQDIKKFRAPHEGKFWKLEVLAVDTTERGKGVGKALMKAVQHIIDQDGSAAYVECGGDKLPSFYKKYGGFNAGEITKTLKLNGDEDKDGISFNALLRASKHGGMKMKSGQVGPTGAPQESTMVR